MTPLRTGVVVSLAFSGAVMGSACFDESVIPEAQPSETGGTAGLDAGTGGAADAALEADSDGSSDDGDAASDDADANGGAAGSAPDVCGAPWTASAAQDSTCDLDALVEGETLSGDISTSKTLVGGKRYRLLGSRSVRVLAGATLTIEPCVELLADGVELVVLPGAKIVAEGTASSPIVLTSAQAKGSRQAGDWYGLMILGNARTNRATETQRPVVPHLGELYGSSNDQNNGESSGTLAYVRVEFAGRPPTALGYTPAAVTFGAVGSGTTVHHVAVANAIGDCFEWLGGTVDADHLVGLNCQDDAFDAEDGYAGRVQFAFGRGFQSDYLSLTLQDTLFMGQGNQAYRESFLPSSNGLELSTIDLYDATRVATAAPLTTARWSNLTLCGQRDYGIYLLEGNRRNGIALRGNTSGAVSNALVTGFHRGFDWSALQDRPDDSPVTLSYSILGDNLTVADPAKADPNNPTLEATQGGLAWFTQQPGNAVIGLDEVCNCWSNPPSPFPAHKIPGGTSAGFVDPAADYVGAFVDAKPESNWMAGTWVGWAEN